jgi:hypothetical protein
MEIMPSPEMSVTVSRAIQGTSHETMIAIETSRNQLLASSAFSLGPFLDPKGGDDTFLRSDCELLLDFMAVIQDGVTRKLLLGLIKLSRGKKEKDLKSLHL